MRLAFFPLTDLGNAERFRERYRERLLWNAALGWLVWDGKRWSREGSDDLIKLAEHDTVRAIQKEAKAVRASGCKDDPDAPRGARDYVVKTDRDGNKTFYSDKIAAWGRSSEAANKLGALSKRGAPYFAVAIDRLDADKMRINVNNGTLVVRRRDDGDYVAFQPHDPADLITKLAPVDFDPQILRVNNPSISLTQRKAPSKSLSSRSTELSTPNFTRDAQKIRSPASDARGFCFSVGREQRNPVGPGFAFSPDTEGNSVLPTTVGWPDFAGLTSEAKVKLTWPRTPVLTYVLTASEA